MPAVQAEAWFKVELISLLYQLQRAGTIASFDRECLTGNGRKKMDFKIEFANLIGAIEVKTALCAQQKKFNYDLMWYAKDTRRDSSFLSDIFKLTSIAGFNPVTPHLLVFAYRAPSIVEWNNTLTEIRSKAPALTISLARERSSSCASLSILKRATGDGSRSTPGLPTPCLRVPSLRSR